MENTEPSQTQESANLTPVIEKTNEKGGGLKALLLGLLTFWFPAYFIFFFIFMASNFIFPQQIQRLISFFPVLILIHVLTILSEIGLFIYYLVHCLHNNSAKENSVLWILGFFFFGPIVMAVYWYKYIWKGSGTAASIIGVIALFILLLIITTAILFGILYLIPPNSSLSFNIDLNSTKAAYGVGNYNDVERYATKALAEATTDIDKSYAHYWLGLSYYGQQEYDQAETEEDAAVQLNTKYGPPYATLAAINLQRQKYQQALDYAQKCMDLDPGYAWCYNDKASALMGLNRISEGIKNFKTAVSLDPSSYVFQDNLSRAQKLYPTP